MTESATFTAVVRERTGTGGARALRRAGMIPAVIYGGNKEPRSIAVSQSEMAKILSTRRYYSTLLTFNVDGKQEHVLAREVQYHPVSDRPEHLDFLRVDKNTAVSVHVPVKFLNRDRCIGIKRGGVLNIVRREVDLMCLPDRIPESITIDLLEVNIGQSIHISHIALPEGVTPAITDRDFTVATITGRSKAGADDAEATTETAAAA